MGGVRPYPKVTCKPSRPRTFPSDGAWRSLVARLLWEQEVAGSNPAAPMRPLADGHEDSLRSSDRAPPAVLHVRAPSPSRSGAGAWARAYGTPRSSAASEALEPTGSRRLWRRGGRSDCPFAWKGAAGGHAREIALRASDPSSAVYGDENETSVFTRAWGVGE